MKKRQIRPNHADILLAPFLAASQLGAQLIQKLRLQSFACELRRLFRIVRLPLFVRKLTANSVSPNRFHLRSCEIDSYCPRPYPDSGGLPTVLRNIQVESYQTA